MLSISANVSVYLCTKATDMRNYAVQAFMRSPGHPLELVSSFSLFEVPPVMRDSA